jgi:hypothetical protein
MASGFTQPLTEISTRRHSKQRSADCLDNMGAPTSHKPVGLHGLLQGQLYFFSICCVRRLCGLVIRVPGYRTRGPGSILGATGFSE